MPIAKLDAFGLLGVEGSDARAFLHAQLTADIAQLGAGRARRAGWCSPKGRLLATFLVVPQAGGFLLQLARDLAAPVAKRLAMYVLRAKVRIADQSSDWPQHGVWGEDAARELAGLGLVVPQADLGVAESPQGRVVVKLAAERFLVLGEAGLQADCEPAHWMLQDIRAGIPWITFATQDQLLPQMVNFDSIGGVDFRKGCYPGQEVVARARYRGAVKRRMYRLRADSSLLPGQSLFCDAQTREAAGLVVNAAEGEALAVLPSAVVESGSPVCAAPAGKPVEILPLPCVQ